MTVPGQIQGADNSTSPFGEKKCEIIFKGLDIGVKNHVHFCKLTIAMITNVWNVSCHKHLFYSYFFFVVSLLLSFSCVYVSTVDVVLH